jgi:preprotein translocase subunit SecA
MKKHLEKKYWTESLMQHRRRKTCPKQEYKREAFEMFVLMLENIKHDVISFLSMVQVRTEEDVEAAEQQQQKLQNMKYNHAASPDALGNKQESSELEPFVRGHRKIGRNEPCPCGSGKKYKQCHGKLYIKQKEKI